MVGNTALVFYSSMYRWGQIVAHASASSSIRWTSEVLLGNANKATVPVMHLNWTFCAARCLLGVSFSHCSQLFPRTVYSVDRRHLRPLPILGEPQRFRWGVQVKPQYQWYIWTEHSVQPGVCLASSFPTALSSWEWGKAPGWPHQQTQSCFFSSNSWVRMSIWRTLHSVDLRHLHQGCSRGGCLILHFEWMNEWSFFFESFFFLWFAAPSSVPTSETLLPCCSSQHHPWLIPQEGTATVSRKAYSLVQKKCFPYCSPKARQWQCESTFLA